MKFKRKLSVIGHIEIAPMVDVVFLLVIYFLVASTLQENTAIKVKLPDSKQTNVVELPKQIIITVTSDNKIFLGNSQVPVSLEKLGDQILKMMEMMEDMGDSKKQIIIRGDEISQYKTIIAVMDELSLRGIKNFNLSVKKGYVQEK
jgi:biopolymer transport protein ExbD